MAAKSKLSRLFLGWVRFLDPTLHHASFPVDQFQFGQTQQIAGMIEALRGTLPSELVVLNAETSAA
jgi:hypothetical protein